MSIKVSQDKFYSEAEKAVKQSQDNETGIFMVVNEGKGFKSLIHGMDTDQLAEIFHNLIEDYPQILHALTVMKLKQIAAKDETGEIADRLAELEIDDAVIN